MDEGGAGTLEGEVEGGRAGHFFFFCFVVWWGGEEVGFWLLLWDGKALLWRCEVL